MAKSGPNPKPTNWKVLHGTDRPEDRRRNEPAPTVGEPPKPRGVLPKRALWYWNKVAPTLIKLGILTEVDLGAWLLVCTWYAVAEQAAELIREEGILSTDEQDRVAKNRALTVLNQASKEYRLLAADFGLTPATRANLDIPEPADADDYEEFLSG